MKNLEDIQKMRYDRGCIVYNTNNYTYGIVLNGKCGEHHTAEDVIMMIKTAPTIDAVPVTRCKDCKYWQDNNDGYPHEECRWGHGETPDANDFCSHGERKEGAD